MLVSLHIFSLIPNLSVLSICFGVYLVLFITSLVLLVIIVQMQLKSWRSDSYSIFRIVMGSKNNCYAVSLYTDTLMAIRFSSFYICFIVSSFKLSRLSSRCLMKICDILNNMLCERDRKLPNMEGSSLP